MIFIYILLLLVSFFFYIQYEGAFSFYLFSFIAAYPIIFGIIMFNLKRKISVSFERGELNALKGASVPVNIVITNRSRLPVPNCIITLKYSTDLTGHSEKLNIHSPIFPNNTQVLTAKFAYKHYGCLKLEITKVKIFDILRVIRCRIKSKRSLTTSKVIVFPNHIPIENRINDYSDLGLESEFFSKSKKGDDPSEIFNIHEYAEGDKISRIHWKLSAKQNEMMVKDYSLPITNGVLIAADFSHMTSNAGELDTFDAIIDSVAALSLRLAENEVTHTLLWCNDSFEGYEKRVVSNFEDYTVSMRELILAGFRFSTRSICDEIHEISSGAPKFAHAIICTTVLTDSEKENLVSSGYSYRYTAIVASKSEDKGYTEDAFTYVPLGTENVAESIEDIAI
ncbi:MAG: DUF58 domain-containing protein [Ruminococcus sp.]|nr:DUF58 domain-containing protein [Ruminococcus sp.]